MPNENEDGIKEPKSPGTTVVKLLVAETVIVPLGGTAVPLQPVLQLVQSLPSTFLQFKLAAVPGGTPVWQQTALTIGSVEEQLVEPHVKERFEKGVGVTAATLAPCLTAFLREFLTYHALANSAIATKRMTNNISTKAVSTNAWPFLFLKFFIIKSYMLFLFNLL